MKNSCGCKCKCKKPKGLTQRQIWNKEDEKVWHPFGLFYTWQIEKKLGLPEDSLKKIKQTTKCFSRFLQNEADKFSGAKSVRL